VYYKYPSELIENARQGKKIGDVGFHSSLGEEELFPPEHRVKAHLHHAVRLLRARMVSAVGSPHRVLHKHDIVGTNASEQVEEVVVRVVDVERLAALEIHVEAFQRAVRSQMAEHRVQVLVVDKSALLGVVHLRVQGGLGVFEEHGDVADETGIARTDHLEELANRLESQLAPVGGPDGTTAAALALEEELVFGVEDAAAFVVDLSTGAQESGRPLEELVRSTEIEASWCNECKAVNFVSQFCRQIKETSAGWARGALAR